MGASTSKSELVEVKEQPDVMYWDSEDKEQDQNDQNDDDIAPSSQTSRTALAATAQIGQVERESKDHSNDAPLAPSDVAAVTEKSENEGHSSPPAPSDTTESNERWWARRHAIPALACILLIAAMVVFLDLLFDHLVSQPMCVHDHWIYNSYGVTDESCSASGPTPLLFCFERVGFRNRGTDPDRMLF
jgi:hypothetical protein